MAATAAPAPQHGSLPKWLIIVMGLIYIGLGVFMLARPVTGAFGLIIYIGATWLVTGVMDLISLVVDRQQWFWKLLNGVIGIWAGLVVLSRPLLSMVLIPTFFVIMLGITGLIYGALRIVQAVRGGGWGMAVLGVLTIIVSLILLGEPLAGAIALPFVIGTIAIAGGILTIAGAFVQR